MSDPPARPTPCPHCGEPVEEDGATCNACGRPLAGERTVACLACGEANPQHARFCLGCGTPLGSVGEAERRVITVLFADLSGFTRLGEQLDAEEVRNLVAGCVDRLCECVTRWGGFVDKFIGDCVMALFGAPIAYENEEERAIRAALDMHLALEDWKIPRGEDIAPDYRPRLRIGINSGPVVTGVFSGGGTVDYTAVGDTVNVASRLQGLCEPGQTLVGHNTYSATRHIFEFDDEQVLQVKGRSEPVRARTVLGTRAVRGRARGFEGRRVGLIGRAAELDRLRERWQSAQEGNLELCLLIGPAGMGKSRLIEEILAAESLDDDVVASGRSYPYSSNTPWEPIGELLRDLHAVPAGLAPSEAARRIAETSPGGWSPEGMAALAIALGEPAGTTSVLQHLSPTERLDLVQRAVTAAVKAGIGEPRLLVLEDLHWADRTTLQFVAALPEKPVPGSALWVLVSRPPLPKEVHLQRVFERIEHRIELSPLTVEQARSFIDALLEEHELPDELLASIQERSEGNPLFIEETLKSMAASGALERRNGHWYAVRELKDLQIPDTIESVLETRIDGLDPGARRVLQYAAIVGRRFWSGVLRDALAGHPVDRELKDLLQGAFVRALPGSTVAQNREFLFEHMMLQEVAYESTLRGMRTELHRAVAEWLEENLAGRVPESDEWIAFHYERSDTPERAVPFLERAAQAARERGALPDADSLIERGLRLVEDADQAFRLLCLADDIAASTGALDRREEVIGELATLVGELTDEEAPVEVGYRRARYLMDLGDLNSARKVAEETLEKHGDLETISREDDLVSLSGRIAHLWGDYSEALRHYEESLPLHRESADRHGEAETLDRLGLVQVDLGDFRAGLEYFDQARRIFGELGLRPMEARVLAHRATALRWLGRLDAAEEAAREALALADACGSRRARATAELTLGWVMAAAGAEVEGLEHLRSACALASELGRPRLEARAWLARAEAESGAEARHSVEQALELARDTGLIHVEILALNRVAVLALEEEDLAEADRLSEEAMNRFRRHGNVQGPEERVLYTRARVLSRRGATDEARGLLEEAKGVVEEKALRLRNPEEQRRYREEVPLNRKILAAASGAELEP